MDNSFMYKEELKFIADDHLGKLARYIRIIGFDCLYFNEIDDKELMEISEREGRIIVTRDWNLYRFVPTQRYLHIKSQRAWDQLKEVCDHFKINPFERSFERCIVCNSLLVRVDKERVKSRVPPKSYQWKDEFYECEGCRRVYWAGTHHEAMLKSIRQAFSS